MHTSCTFSIHGLFVFFCQKFTKLDFILSHVCVFGRHQISLSGLKLQKFPDSKDCLAVFGSALRSNQPDGALPDNPPGPGAGVRDRLWWISAQGASCSLPAAGPCRVQSWQQSRAFLMSLLTLPLSAVCQACGDPRCNVNRKWNMPEWLKTLLCYPVWQRDVKSVRLNQQPVLALKMLVGKRAGESSLAPLQTLERIDHFFLK